MHDIQNKSAADNTACAALHNQPTTKKQRIIADYLGGMTVRELAEKYHRTCGGVQTSLWLWGVKLPEGERIRRLNANRTARGQSWPDCPGHLLEDYKTLRRYMTAREARATLERQL